jgi:hypothetical protein
MLGTKPMCDEFVRRRITSREMNTHCESFERGENLKNRRGFILVQQWKIVKPNLSPKLIYYCGMEIAPKRDSGEKMKSL